MWIENKNYMQYGLNISYFYKEFVSFVYKKLLFFFCYSECYCSQFAVTLEVGTEVYSISLHFQPVLLPHCLHDFCNSK